MFVTVVDDRVKLKERKKKDISTRTLLGKRKKKKKKKKKEDKNKLWNRKVTVIPIVIGSHGTVTKVLVKDLEEFKIRTLVDTVQTTALSGLTRIPRRVLEA